MKLLDILVLHKEEIVDPGEATNYLAMDPDGRVFGYQEKPEPNVVGWSVPGVKNSTDGNGCLMQFNPIDLKENWSECIVTREQYEAALAASKKEWDGECLPPVGCDCEFQAEDGSWGVGTVLCVGNLRVFWLCHEDGMEYNAEIEPREFRPIRSEADKKRDEAIESITSLIEYRNGCHAKALAKWLFEEIAAGKIQHIRID